MENYSYSSYPDSVNSSPRSREIDCENASWDDQPPSTNYKVKFMCSYGGKILPRPHDNQLAYVGGETKILSVDRNTRFSALVTKLSSLSDYDVCFKYQLPGEDLDALISVTNDEDLEHMMLEYDRIYRGSVKPARLRLFLFPLSSTPATSNFGSTDSKPESQWFVDALNSVQLQNLDVNSPTAVSVSSGSVPANNPDFLFGLDKGQPQQQTQPVKQQDQTPPPPPTVVTEIFGKDFGSSDAGSEDRHVIGDTVISPVDYERQIHELQQKAMYNRKIEEHVPRVFPGEYYQQKAQPPAASVPVTNPGAFWPERHVTSGPYPATVVQTEQQPPPSPVYIVQTPAGVYRTPANMRPVTSQVGATHQPYYGMQRMVPEVYREQPIYGGVPPQPTVQQPKMGGPYTSDNMGMVRPQHAPAEPTYTQVGYDSVGRQIYYTAPPAGVMQQQMQHPAMVAAAAAVAADGRQSGGALHPEGRIVGKP